MTDDLLQRLRQADPAAELDADPHDAIGRRLRSAALGRTDGGAARVRPRVPRHGGADRSRRRVPRGRTALVVAVLLAVSTVGAFAAGLFEPDPADVTAIVDRARDEGRFDVHLDGWRPELTTEVVLCASEDGSSVLTPVSELPLDEPLTERVLVDECVVGNDLARSGVATAPSEVTVCGASLTPEAVQARVASLDARLLAGSMADERFALPVVLGWAADCSQVHLAAPPDRTLGPLPSLDAVDAARAEEIRLTAASLRSCLDHDAAIELATDARTRLGDAWLLLDETAGGEGCHEIWIEAEPSWITIVTRS